MSVSHGYSTIGGIECGGGFVGKVVLSRGGPHQKSHGGIITYTFPHTLVVDSSKHTYKKQNKNVCNLMHFMANRAHMSVQPKIISRDQCKTLSFFLSPRRCTGDRRRLIEPDGCRALQPLEGRLHHEARSVHRVDDRRVEMFNLASINIASSKMVL
ncbi:hypothetical protein ZWY2020_029249 [Hordeum vulgare]|nr:hypothetical protein ZWY2020_029249 [Hordeum vulgare]